MSGALWALAAGAGFGLFQTVNRRTVDGMDVYFSTFVQLVVAALVFVIASLATADLHILLIAPLLSLFYFAIAGLFHFVAGWTFLNASQKQIGASRTSPLIGTNPLFATVLAAVTLSEFPSWLQLFGIVVIVLGAYFVSREPDNSSHIMSGRQSLSSVLQASYLGLSAALCWAISPIFIRLGLQGLPSPLLGVTVGVGASAIGYGIILLWQRERWHGIPITREVWMFKLLAGFLVGVSTWMRWIALDLAPVAVVLALTMISTPLVLLLSPIVSGKHLEHVTATLWFGTSLILGGALLLTFI